MEQILVGEPPKFSWNNLMLRPELVELNDDKSVINSSIKIRKIHSFNLKYFKTRMMTRIGLMPRIHCSSMERITYLEEI